MSSILTWLLIFGVVQIIVLLLIFVGIPLLILRSILGGRSRGGSAGGMPTSDSQQFAPRQGGFPTSFYTGSKRLSNFNVDPSLYDFRTPTIKPNLGALRNPANIDMDTARKLFLGGGIPSLPRELPRQILDLDKARELFLPGQGGMLDPIYPEDEEGEVEDSSFS